MLIYGKIQHPPLMESWSAYLCLIDVDCVHVHGFDVLIHYRLLLEGGHNRISHFLRRHGLPAVSWNKPIEVFFAVSLENLCYRLSII